MTYNFQKGQDIPINGDFCVWTAKKGRWLTFSSVDSCNYTINRTQTYTKGVFSWSCCYKCELGSCFSCSKKKKKKEQEESRKWHLERGYEINLVRTMPTHAFARTAKQAGQPPSPQKARIQNFVQKCLDDLQYKTGAKLLGVSVKWHLDRGYEINLVCTMPTHVFAQNAWATEGQNSNYC